MSEKDIVAINTSTMVTCTMDVHPFKSSLKRINVDLDTKTPILKRPFIDSFSPSSIHICYPNLKALITLISQHEKRIVLNETQMSQTGYTVQNRKVLIEWMKDFSTDHHLDHETYHLSVLLLDRFFAESHFNGYSKSKFQLIALICLMIAIKHNEAMSATPKEMLYFVGFDESVENIDEIVALERTILHELDWSIFASTCIKAIYQVVESFALWEGEEKGKHLSRCFHICDMLVLSPRFYEFSLMEIALSVIQHVNFSRGILRGSLRCSAWIEMIANSQ